MSLRTQRLWLRPFRDEDVDDVFAYAADERWSRYLDPVVPFPYTRDHAVDFVQRKVGATNHVPLAVEHEGRVVGAIEIRPDERRYVAELGWALARRLWGQGLMTEAIRTVCDHCFDALELERVYARANLDNTGSWRVMEKVGMRREALLRQHGIDRYGVPYDEVWYALIRADR